MRSRSEERLKAERLRREEGLSYSEIAAQTGISKSTLSNWLRDIALKPEYEARLQARLRANRAAFAARAWPINRLRHEQAREEAYQDGARIISALPKDKAVDELAVAMLYLGEGSKSGNRVQLASTNASILCYFVQALVRIYAVDTRRLSLRLNLVDAARPVESQLRMWWSRQLDCSPDQFTKTQFDSRSRASRLTGDYRGVCTVTYHNTYLQQRLIGLGNAYIQSRGASVGTME